MRVLLTHPALAQNGAPITACLPPPFAGDARLSMGLEDRRVVFWVGARLLAHPLLLIGFPRLLIGALAPPHLCRCVLAELAMGCPLYQYSSVEQVRSIMGIDRH